MRNCAKKQAYFSGGILLVSGCTWRVQIVIAGHVKIAAYAWRKDGDYERQLVALKLLKEDKIWISLQSQATKNWRRSSKLSGCGASHGQISMQH